MDDLDLVYHALISSVQESHQTWTVEQNIQNRLNGDQDLCILVSTDFLKDDLNLVT